MSLIDLILVPGIAGVIAGIILSQMWRRDHKLSPLQFLATVVLTCLFIGLVVTDLIFYSHYNDTETVMVYGIILGVEILVFGVLRLARKNRLSGSGVATGPKSHVLRTVADSGGSYFSQPSVIQSHQTYEPIQPAGNRTIFISYRRDDTQDVAGRIYDRLVSTFGPRSVFKDVDTIRPGEDFRAAINAFLNQCDVVLVLIGNQWIDARDARGARRLEDAGDFVRIEIETALRQGATVIPVLVQNAKMPSKRNLPRSMHQLLYNNAVVIRPDPDFHRDMERLVNALC